MDSSSLSSFREYLGGASSVSDSLLEGALAQAARHIGRSGIASDHEAFADMQNAYAAYLLEMRGAIDVGSIQSKSVGDISTNFSTGKVRESYLDIYNQIRMQIFRFNGRFGSMKR